MKTGGAKTPKKSLQIYSRLREGETIVFINTPLTEVPDSGIPSGKLDLNLPLP